MEETIPGTKVVAERLVRAEENFVRSLVEFGRIDQAAAWKVFALYVQLRAVRRKGVDRWEVVHGAYLDRDVIQRALAQATSETSVPRRARPR